VDAEDWLKGVEKKLVIAQCTDREKVLFTAHQLYGTVANWWETYCNTHANIDTITWNEFKAHFRTHYVPRGTMKLKRKEFTELSSPMSELPDAKASTATTSTQRAATISPEHAARPTE
jgi:hypothetical protein